MEWECNGNRRLTVLEDEHLVILLMLIVLIFSVLVLQAQFLRLIAFTLSNNPNRL